MGRNTPHKCAQRRLKQALTTGVPVLDLVESNPLENISTNTGTYQSDILTGDTEVHVGNRITDILVKSRQNTQLNCACAIEVIDTSPPDYAALINHLRSGYSIALVYITDGDANHLLQKPLVQDIRSKLGISRYTPGWIDVENGRASLGDIFSLNNISYRVKSWLNELTPRLNSSYTWLFEEAIVPYTPVSYPITHVGMFEAVKPDCIDRLKQTIYDGYYDHTGNNPVVYLVDNDQSFVKLNHSDLQKIQDYRALARLTPLPGQTPHLNI
jgi:hypothetical protein